MDYLDYNEIPNYIDTEEELDSFMSLPSKQLIDFQKELDGNVLILGVGGKIGIQLAMMLKNASEIAGIERQIVGASRFSDEAKKKQLEDFGIETITCDLLDPGAVENLPDFKNVVFMLGRKFGTEGSEDLTWAMNTLVPGYVGRKFKKSRILAYSSGNVYGMTSLMSGGSVEDDNVKPQGEYALSVLGRERIFQYCSRRNGTPVVLLRLNYAIDLRYGVLREIGEKVKNDEPVDLSTGSVNVIWQGDAINQSLLAFSQCSAPAKILNITGPEIVSVKYAASLFGSFFGKKPYFVGEENNTALLNNASYVSSLFGYPKVPLYTMLRWIAHWIEIGGSSLNKPTHFESRDGTF